mmetsp:Transcript_5512/g.8403  ORF Transcript_5512/g.8403 Transcript_5512/m.8403 type:complete len:501 (+) Transcript_5512:107-1609(+)
MIGGYGPFAAVAHAVFLMLVMDHGRDQNDISADALFSKLLKVAKVSAPTTELALKENRFGIRGVFAGNNIDDIGGDESTVISSSKSTIDRGDILLSVPLSSCVLDASSKLVFTATHQEGKNNHHRKNGNKDYEEQDWEFLLAKAFVDFTHNNESILKAWTELLPDPIELRSSLPLHWPDISLDATGIDSFQQLAMTNRLVQQKRVALLLDTSKDPLSTSSGTAAGGILSTRSLNDVLDLCNTRMCRVVLDDDDNRNNSDEDVAIDGAYYSCCILAPGFDMINHASHGYNNASYKLERTKNNGDSSSLSNEYSLVVRSKRDMDPGEEILIDYGEVTRDLNCLHNYGFLPNNGASVEVGGEIKIVLQRQEKEVTSTHALNFRRNPYGFDVDLVKLASVMVSKGKKKQQQDIFLGEDEAEWIIGQIDDSIQKSKMLLKRKRQDNGNSMDDSTSATKVGMDWAPIVNDMNIQLLSKCRRQLLSERIKNPLRKMKLTLRQMVQSS